MYQIISKSTNNLTMLDYAKFCKVGLNQQLSLGFVV